MTARKRNSLKKAAAPEKAAPAAQPDSVPDPQPDSEAGKGFYEKVMDAAETLDFKTAAGNKGLDDEITLLRVSIKSLVADDPKNLKMIMQATNMLAKLVKIRYSMTKEQKKGLGEAIRKAITEIGVPLGVSIINKKL